MTHKEKAYTLFTKGYNCSQAVFAAFSDVTGIEVSTSLKLSSSFGGGMGRMREVCGACSGMFMIAGVLYGYDKTDDKEKLKEHYALVQSLASKFKENHGSIICRELLSGLKPGTSPTPTTRDESFYTARPCVKFVLDAVDIIESLLDERGDAK